MYTFWTPYILHTISSKLGFKITLWPTDTLPTSIVFKLQTKPWQVTQIRRITKTRKRKQ